MLNFKKHVCGIMLLILAAILFPINAMANAENCSIKVTNVIPSTGSSLRIMIPEIDPATKQAPSIDVEFYTSNTYILVDAENHTMIDGPIPYDPITSRNIFPTPNGFDPGYRAVISGFSVDGYDKFNLKWVCNDSFNISTVE